MPNLQNRELESFVKIGNGIAENYEAVSIGLTLAQAIRQVLLTDEKIFCNLRHMSVPGETDEWRLVPGRFTELEDAPIATVVVTRAHFVIYIGTTEYIFSCFKEALRFVADGMSRDKFPLSPDRWIKATVAVLWLAIRESIKLVSHKRED